MGPPIGVLPRNSRAYTDMTRPRMAAVLVSCRVELAVAMNVIEHAPISVRRGKATARVGANAVAVIITPKATHPPARTTGVGRARLAVHRAPTMEPTPMHAVITPNV